MSISRRYFFLLSQSLGGNLVGASSPRLELSDNSASSLRCSNSIDWEADSYFASNKGEGNNKDENEEDEDEEVDDDDDVDSNKDEEEEDEDEEVDDDDDDVDNSKSLFDMFWISWALTRSVSDKQISTSDKSLEPKSWFDIFSISWALTRSLSDKSFEGHFFGDLLTIT